MNLGILLLVCIVFILALVYGYKTQGDAPKSEKDEYWSTTTIIQCVMGICIFIVYMTRNFWKGLISKYLKVEQKSIPINKETSVASAMKEIPTSEETETFSRTKSDTDTEKSESVKEASEKSEKIVGDVSRYSNITLTTFG